MEYKVCSKCGVSKSIDSFYKNKGVSDGYKARCKQCYCKEQKIRLNNLRVNKRIIDNDSTKICNKCFERKGLCNFYITVQNKDGYANTCIVCLRKYGKSKRQYIKENPIVHTKVSNKKCTKCAVVKDINMFYRKTAAKDGRQSFCKKCCNIYIRSYTIERNKVDPLFKLRNSLRTLISSSIRRGGYLKGTKTFDILGVDFKTFKKYMENKFTEGMSWDNHGEWHLDHIVPMASALNHEDALRLNHYTNFQPLWAKENILKSDDILEVQLTLTI